MKKFISVIFLIVIFTGIYGQKIGVKGGLDFCTVSTDLTDETGFNNGLNASVFFQKNLIPLFSIRPGLGYYEKGYTSEILGVQSDAKLDYLQLDLDLRLKAGFLPIYFLAGPYASYALSGTATTAGIKSEIDFESDKTLPYDFGLAGGIGYMQNFAVIKLFIESKFEYGLNDYNDYSDKYYKNRNIVVSLGIMFGL